MSVRVLLPHPFAQASRGNHYLVDSAGHLEVTGALIRRFFLLLQEPSKHAA
jgi:hypothetical protein